MRMNDRIWQPEMMLIKLMKPLGSNEKSKMVSNLKRVLIKQNNSIQMNKSSLPMLQSASFNLQLHIVISSLTKNPARSWSVYTIFLLLKFSRFSKNSPKFNYPYLLSYMQQNVICLTVVTTSQLTGQMKWEHGRVERRGSVLVDIKAQKESERTGRKSTRKGGNKKQRGGRSSLCITAFLWRKHT